MNLVKIFPLLLVFLGLIPSCRCPEIDPYYMPTELKINAIWNNSSYDEFQDLIIEEADGFELWVDFSKTEFLVKQTVSFTNTLMATQPCPEDGYLGLKYKATSITITSSSEFMGIPAGENINEFFHILEYIPDSMNSSGQYEEVSIENMISQLNNGYGFYTHIPILISELPENNLAHTFSVELEFENGRVLSGNSSPVQF